MFKLQAVETTALTWLDWELVPAELKAETDVVVSAIRPATINVVSPGYTGYGCVWLHLGPVALRTLYSCWSASRGPSSLMVTLAPVTAALKPVE